MALSKPEFSVLSCLAANPRAVQRDIAGAANLSLGSINTAHQRLNERHFLSGNTITSQGLEALQEHKVQNAIIMAAGLSSRFAPISYEKPKGLFKVRGEVLIERQIEQLIAAGITDITVVVGYKKEYFFYLEDKYGVHLAINTEFASRNNHSSLMCVKERLGNTFVCSSDNYFEHNPFEAYVWKAYYSAQYQEGPTQEWCLNIGAQDRIVGVEIGGANAWYMIGHAYFDTAFSTTLMQAITRHYNAPETPDKLWEAFLMEHVKKLDMVVRKHPNNDIHEFDSLDEVKDFDPLFIENLDSDIFDNIASVLCCEKNSITDIYPLKQGLTNLSCHFRVGEQEYVYRHPGVGTELIIDRAAEVAAQQVAKKLGLDDTFIFEDAARGWKISQFIPRCTSLDPHNDTHVQTAMEMAARLHSEAVSVDKTFSFFAEGKRYETHLQEHGAIDVPGYYEMAAKAQQLNDYLLADQAPICLTHNDFFHLNFLVDERGKYYLIDWEYAGMADYASDYGTFVVCTQLDENEALRALEFYFGRAPTAEEIRHNFACVGLAGWCWYVWALLKESEGDFVGEWLYIYYNYAKRYLDKALALYEQQEPLKEVK